MMKYALIHASFLKANLKMNFPTKYTISTPLMIENPVRSPMVPPIADNISVNLAALSFVILSNVGESKKILTYRILLFHS